MGRLIDLTGKRFGRLTVIERDYNYEKTHRYDKPYWKCICDCGNIKTTASKCLRNGHTKSCGCLQKETIGNLNFINRVGQRYGKLTVQKYIGGSKWECLCECGTITNVYTVHLSSGHTTSCGCVRSKGELAIKKYLIDHNIDFETECTRTGLRNSNGNLVRFDFAIFNKNKKIVYFIEHNGLQHYNETDPWYSKSIVESDKLKQQYAQLNNIPLLIIDYGENIENILNQIDFSKIVD